MRALAVAAGALSAAAVLPASISLPEVGAYPSNHFSCRHDNVTFRYQGSNWGSTRQTYFRNGAFLWNGVQRPTGGRWTEIETGAPFGILTDVYRQDLGGNTVGQSNCSFANLYLDDGPVNEEIAAVAIHEMGHTLGMRHSGSSDAIGSSDEPAMSTCRPFDSAYITQDDSAHMAELYSNTLHADASYENQVLNWWGRVETSMTIVTGVASEGQASARLEATSGTAPKEIFQTIRHIEPGPTRMRANYKDGTPDTSGSVVLRLQAQRVSYPTLGTDNCGYVNSWNLNSPTVGGWTWVTAGASASVQDGWNYADSAAWTPPSNWQAANVRLHLYKDTTGQIWVDNVRGYQS